MRGRYLIFIHFWLIAGLWLSFLDPTLAGRKRSASSGSLFSIAIEGSKVRNVGNDFVFLNSMICRYDTESSHSLLCDRIQRGDLIITPFLKIYYANTHSMQIVYVGKWTGKFLGYLPNDHEHSYYDLDEADRFRRNANFTIENGEILLDVDEEGLLEHALKRRKWFDTLKADSAFKNFYRSGSGSAISRKLVHQAVARILVLQTISSRYHIAAGEVGLRRSQIAPRLQNKKDLLEHKRRFGFDHMVRARADETPRAPFWFVLKISNLSKLMTVSGSGRLFSGIRYIGDTDQRDGFLKKHPNLITNGR